MKFWQKLISASLAITMSTGIAYAESPKKVKMKLPPSVTAEVPVFSQKIQFQLPSHWKAVFTDQNANAYLIEFIPRNEDLKNWQNMVTLQGHKNHAPQITAQQVSQNIANGFSKICPQDIVFTQLGDRQISGYPAYLSIIGCASMKGKDENGTEFERSEISYYVVIKGEKDLYIMLKSIRGPVFGTDKFPKMVENAISDMRLFFPLNLCKRESPRGKCLK